MYYLSTNYKTYFSDDVFEKRKLVGQLQREFLHHWMVHCILQ